MFDPATSDRVPRYVWVIAIVGTVLAIALISASCAPLPLEPLEAAEMPEGRDVTGGGTVPGRRVIADGPPVVYTVDERDGSVQWEGTPAGCQQTERGYRHPHYTACNTVLRVLSGPYEGRVIRSSCGCPTLRAVQARPYGMAPCRLSIEFKGFASVNVHRGDVPIAPDPR